MAHMLLQGSPAGQGTATRAVILQDPEAPVVAGVQSCATAALNDICKH